MKYQCPHCLGVGEIKRKHLGRPSKCPTCEREFTVRPFYGDSEKSDRNHTVLEDKKVEEPKKATSTLEPCDDCGKPLSYRASACPHCGAPKIRFAYDEDRFHLVLFNLLTAGMLVAFLGSFWFAPEEMMSRILGSLILVAFLSLRYHLFMLRRKIGG